MMVGELIVKARGTDAKYRSFFENGGFVSIAESRVPRRCGHVGCSGVLRAKSRVCGSVSQAEKDAAACLIRLLRWRHGVVAGDAN
jgi:hypothetical protein